VAGFSRQRAPVDPWWRASAGEASGHRLFRGRSQGV